LSPCQLIEQKREAIMRLARLESLDVRSEGKMVPKSKKIFIGEIELYLPLKDLVDTEKEQKRINKEIDNKKKFIQILEKKLSNKGFTGNAPKAVIMKENERLNEERLNLKKLQKSLKEL